MKPPPEREAIKQVEEQLSILLRSPITTELQHEACKLGVDGVAKVRDMAFAIEWKNSSNLASIISGIEALRPVQGSRKYVALLATPYMTESGRNRCRQNGINWLDLCGNAEIDTKSALIHIEGRPNRFAQPGRPPNLFAPKSARVIRLLLTHAGTRFSQRELSRLADVDEALTSRLVSRLQELGFVKKDTKGELFANNPSGLLDAWAEKYDFAKHDITKGHVSAQTGESVLGRVAKAFDELGVPHAFTGLSGAWLISSFAGFRTVTVYVSRPLSSDELRNRLPYRDEPRGANLWLVYPNDEGVFQDSSPRNGIVCAHPVQVWLDLKAQPERASEAAQQLRSEIEAEWTSQS